MNEDNKNETPEGGLIGGILGIILVIVGVYYIFFS